MKSVRRRLSNVVTKLASVGPPVEVAGYHDNEQERAKVEGVPRAPRWVSVVPVGSAYIPPECGKDAHEPEVPSDGKQQPEEREAETPEDVGSSAAQPTLSVGPTPAILELEYCFVPNDLVCPTVHCLEKVRLASPFLQEVALLPSPDAVEGVSCIFKESVMSESDLDDMCLFVEAKLGQITRKRAEDVGNGATGRPLWLYIHAMDFDAWGDIFTSRFARLEETILRRMNAGFVQGEDGVMNLESCGRVCIRYTTRVNPTPSRADEVAVKRWKRLMLASKRRLVKSVCSRSMRKQVKVGEIIAGIEYGCYNAEVPTAAGMLSELSWAILRIAAGLSPQDPDQSALKASGVIAAGTGRSDMDVSGVPPCLRVVAFNEVLRVTVCMLAGLDIAPEAMPSAQSLLSSIHVDGDIAKNVVFRVDHNVFLFARAWKVWNAQRCRSDTPRNEAIDMEVALYSKSFLLAIVSVCPSTKAIVLSLSRRLCIKSLTATDQVHWLTKLLADNMCDDEVLPLLSLATRHYVAASAREGAEADDTKRRQLLREAVEFALRVSCGLFPVYLEIRPVPIVRHNLLKRLSVVETLQHDWAVKFGGGQNLLFGNNHVQVRIGRYSISLGMAADTKKVQIDLVHHMIDGLRGENHVNTRLWLGGVMGRDVANVIEDSLSGAGILKASFVSDYNKANESMNKELMGVEWSPQIAVELRRAGRTATQQLKQGNAIRGLLTRVAIADLITNVKVAESEGIGKSKKYHFEKNNCQEHVASILGCMGLRQRDVVRLYAETRKQGWSPQSCDAAWAVLGSMENEMCSLFTSDVTHTSPTVLYSQCIIVANHIMNAIRAGETGATSMGVSPSHCKELADEAVKAACQHHRDEMNATVVHRPYLERYASAVLHLVLRGTFAKPLPEHGCLVPSSQFLGHPVRLHPDSPDNIDIYDTAVRNNYTSEQLIGHGRAVAQEA